ncbi:MAG: arylesterase [Hyphomicrobium sp. 32-62-53]|nr:MAG: arylesterase [Hyphomicrobium sp. 12-62-95]OYY01186.1 MAG: arylesterase [Hyphomicrobium sp. 32-62-53]
MISAPTLRQWRRPLHLGLLAVLFNAAILLTLTPAEAKTPVKLVAFGDSLTAGYMLKPDESFPAQLAKALAAKGYAVDVTNAGVSGDTTAAGLERFDWAIPEGTEAVILELGANDALRGQSPADAKANLDTIITKLKERNIAVLLTGMLAPTNWGADYARDFDGMYRDLAAKHGLLLYPFFLEGVALDKSLNLDDGLHPNGKGVAKIVQGIMPQVEDLLRQVETKRASVQSKS